MSFYKLFIQISDLKVLMNTVPSILYLSFRSSQIYSIIYNKPTRCNSGSIVFTNNCRYALHVSYAHCVHHQEHYKL